MYTSRRAILITVFSAAALISLLLVKAAHTDRARLNIMQVVAMLFFLQIIARHFRKSGMFEESDQKLEISSRAVLWLPLVTAAMIWAATIPLYFIDDDFAHLSAAQRPPLESLWELTTRGQLNLFLRPVGFATIFLDYRLYGHAPAGYHVTNLFIHLVAIAGLFYVCRVLGFGSQLAVVAALIFSVLPIETEAVAWIGARFDLLSACFTIWAIFFYVKFRRSGGNGRYFASMLCFFLAMLSKENAYILPVLLVALEYLIMPRRSLRPVSGFFTLAICLFLYRWIILGGVGGYAKDGMPIVFDITPKTLQGLFVRAPSVLLLGFNWVQPPLLGVTILASLTSGVLLTLAWYSRPMRAEWKRLFFCVAWVVLPLLPAHPLLLINADLMASRVLYLSCAGLSILISQLLTGIYPVRVRWVIAGALTCLFSIGIVHNLGAWKWTSQLQEDFISEITELESNPPTRAVFVFHDMPQVVRGVFFMRDQLPDVVRMALGRDDLDAVRSPAFDSEENRWRQRPVIHIQWRGVPGALIVPMPK